MPHCPVIGIAWWQWAKKTSGVSYLPKEAVVPLKPNLRFQVKILSIVKICQDLYKFKTLSLHSTSLENVFGNLSLHQTKCTLFHQAAMTTSVVDRSYPVTLNLHLSFNISPPIHEVFRITFVSQPPNGPSLNMFEPSHWIFSAHSKSCPRSTPRTRSCPAAISRSSHHRKA